MNTDNKLRNAIINGITNGVQSTCSGVHIGLRYGIAGIERVESSFMKRVHGQESKLTIDDRRTNTNQVLIRNERLWLEFKDKLASKFGTKEDVIIESILHGDAK